MTGLHNSQNFACWFENICAYVKFLLQLSNLDFMDDCPDDITDAVTTVFLISIVLWNRRVILLVIGVLVHHI